MKITFDDSHLSVKCVYEHVKGLIRDLTYEKGTQLSLQLNKDDCITSPQSICRHLAKLSKNFNGTTIAEQTEIDHWLDFSQNSLKTSLKQLNDILATREFLVGNRLTLADLVVGGALRGIKNELNGFSNVSKYLSSLNGKTVASSSTKSQTKNGEIIKSEPKDYSKEGKFIDLPNAEKGKVVVRFPPEASGYLHIGHAKAALLNQFYQKEFEGKLIFRFDDTNPAKENSEFERVILDDIRLLGIQPDLFSRTSDHFETLLQLCEKMIRLGRAYADDTDAEEMKRQREKQIESANRSNSVEKNLEIWQEMKRASEVGLSYCIRAKIDMKSNNGAMRDPTIYRCKPEHHIATGDKYKVYPTYDFACPIVDSVEGVTHALRTTEYHDRDDQYYWFCEALEIRKPYIYEYSRFNLQNTVLSKRKLTWFVNEKKVDGWDDPRFPTVKGILRRGMTVDALKQFIIAQGSSRSVVQMEWDKIWTINKGIIDPKSPRHTAILKDNTVLVNVLDQFKEESKQIQKHPKNAEVGMKTIWYSPKLLIDYADAESIKKGDIVTFMEWGNLKIQEIHMKNNKIDSIDAKLNLENKDFKNTLKITWLAQATCTQFTPLKCILFDHIISKPVLDKDDDFKQFCTHQTKFEFDALGDPEMSKIKKGDIIQIQRRGYFICDQEYSAEKSQPCVLFNIPDGSKKESPTSFMSITNQVYFTSTVVANTQQAITNQNNETNGPKKAAQASTNTILSSNKSVESILVNIKKIGDDVRDLKAKKSAKETIDSSVKQLLALKEDFKKQTGQDWTPNIQVTALKTMETSEAKSATSTSELDEKIKKVGDEIRDLKAKKASKDTIDLSVKQLLALKQEFKKQTGQDWKPDTPAAVSKTMETSQTNSATSSSSSTLSGSELNDKIKIFGDEIRDLKAKKASKDQIDSQVKVLLELKSQYKKATGQEWKPEGGPAETTTKKVEKPLQEKKPEKQQQQPKQVKEPVVEDASQKKTTRLCLEAKKEENLAEWYSQLITKAELIEYYDVSGCYILRPWSYFIWEQIKAKFDADIRKLGVQNCYFPLFVSRAALEREKDHIEDFAPEVAWVTKSGTSDLAEPIAIRPTSETVMYPAYAKWIQSHRDLPYKLNQWNNVVRWEFKNPQPFLRTREFLWQEGHTAFANLDEASQEVYQILDLYADVYKSLLAVPVIKGRKTEKEKFAGADWTTTIEAFVSASGRGIQAATSHHLGQNFSKMFEIVYQDPETKQKKYVYQNSWGLTTRTIGILAMVHGDNIGLVLPPRVAHYQVVIVPCGITASLSKEDEKILLDKCKSFEYALSNAGMRVYGDYRDNYSPGWKFNHWELKGVPVRLELGPRDITNKKFVTVRRDTGAKDTHDEAGLVSSMHKLLNDIHDSMYAKAEADLKAHIVVTDSWDEFLKSIDVKKIIMSPFCGEKDCEAMIKNDSARDAVVEEGAPAMGAKSLCIPLEQPKQITTQTCVHPSCKRQAKYYTLFGRSY